jgi:hypothetical protein
VNKKNFIRIMEKFAKKKIENEKFYDQCYNLFGAHFIDTIMQKDNEPFMIEVIEAELNDECKWLSYFIYECKMNFETFCDWIEMPDGSKPEVACWGDLYDFIKEDSE